MSNWKSAEQQRIVTHKRRKRSAQLRHLGVALKGRHARDLMYRIKTTRGQDRPARKGFESYLMTLIRAMNLQVGVHRRLRKEA